MSHYVFATDAIFSMLAIFIMLAACEDGFFLPSQMLAKGYRRGLPLLVHGGMWAEFTFVSPFLGHIVDQCHSQWSMQQIIGSLIMGFIGSGIVHTVCADRSIDLPEAYARHGRLTAAGWIHFVYMGGAIMIFELFYFCTSEIPKELLVIMSVALGMYVFLSTHMVLGIFNPRWYGGRPSESILRWSAIVGAIVLLGGRCLAD